MKKEGAEPEKKVEKARDVYYKTEGIVVGAPAPKNTTWPLVTSCTGGRLPATCTASRAPAPARSK